MPNIDLSVIYHKLSIDPSFRPIVRRHRLFNQDRDQAIQEEVNKLLAADLISKVHYLEWIANVVLVKMANGKCANVCRLHRPKDSYPLSKVDQLVDATADHALLSFMDAFFGYLVRISNDIFPASQKAISYDFSENTRVNICLKKFIPFVFL